ncbi:unnamed protein product [Symbiodinium sp. CCMP2456]|nr:unnamed protein product [Symbiodinium sp. CCMP2456]
MCMQRWHARILQGASVMKGTIPVTKQRLEKIGTRVNEDLLADHSMAQFRRTQAPPAPEQKKTLMHEDFSPTVTRRDPDRVKAGGTFTRTQMSHPSSPKAQESLPPPRRAMVYPAGGSGFARLALGALDALMSRFQNSAHLLSLCSTHVKGHGRLAARVAKGDAAAAGSSGSTDANQWGV